MSFFDCIEYPPLSPPNGKPFRLLNKYNGDLRFIDLLDTFSDYRGMGGRVIVVREDESGLAVSASIIESDKTFCHVQIIPSNRWEIHHNLGKFPTIGIIDSDGNNVLTNIEHVNENTVRIISSIAFTGTSYLN